jgi:hypothetical protein
LKCCLVSLFRPVILQVASPNKKNLTAAASSGRRHYVPMVTKVLTIPLFNVILLHIS